MERTTQTSEYLLCSPFATHNETKTRQNLETKASGFPAISSSMGNGEHERESTWKAAGPQLPASAFWGISAERHAYLGTLPCHKSQTC